jgi:hypothetical protein
LAVDYGFRSLFPSTRECARFVNQTLATANRVFLVQMGLQLELGELIIMESPGGWAWNRAPDPVGGKKPSSPTTPGLCGTSITQLLDDFTAWRRDERPTQQAVWHLLTNCFPPQGTVGLSWMGGLCRSDIGAGLSSFSSTLWLTMSHELGHSLGAPHAFQLGQGKTGGIMDYADGCSTSAQ